MDEEVVLFKPIVSASQRQPLYRSKGKLMIGQCVQFQTNTGKWKTGRLMELDDIREQAKVVFREGRQREVWASITGLSGLEQSNSTGIEFNDIVLVYREDKGHMVPARVCSFQRGAYEVVFADQSRGRADKTIQRMNGLDKERLIDLESLRALQEYDDLHGDGIRTGSNASVCSVDEPNQALNAINFTPEIRDVGLTIDSAGCCSDHESIASSATYISCQMTESSYQLTGTLVGGARDGVCSDPAARQTFAPPRRRQSSISTVTISDDLSERFEETDQVPIPIACMAPEPAIGAGSGPQNGKRDAFSYSPVPVLTECPTADRDELGGGVSTDLARSVDGSPGKAAPPLRRSSRSGRTYFVLSERKRAPSLRKSGAGVSGSPLRRRSRRGTLRSECSEAAKTVATSQRIEESEEREDLLVCHDRAQEDAQFTLLHCTCSSKSLLRPLVQCDICQCLSHKVCVDEPEVNQTDRFVCGFCARAGNDKRAMRYERKRHLYDQTWAANREREVGAVNALRNRAATVSVLTATGKSSLRDLLPAKQGNSFTA